jgi:hypothetical protein
LGDGPGCNLCRLGSIAAGFGLRRIQRREFKVEPADALLVSHEADAFDQKLVQRGLLRVSWTPRLGVS